MKKLFKTQLVSALILSGGMVIAGSATAAEDISITSKLQQSEAALMKAAGAGLSDDDIWRAKNNHRKLITEVLQHLNKRNADVSAASGKSLSDEEVLNNFRAIGRLLETIAADYPVKREPYDYISEYE